MSSEQQMPELVQIHRGAVVLVEPFELLLGNKMKLLWYIKYYHYAWIWIPKQNKKNNKHFTREIWCSKTIEDLPSNALIWEGPTAPILPRNAVQRSELLGRKKQSLCCLCHQKLVSPCHHSFKKMGVQGIGGELVWLTWAQPLPYITGGSRFQNSEHHSVSLLEPTWKILSTTFDASASSAERWLNGKTAECCASHRGRWTAAWGALNCHPVAGELLGKTKGLDACGGSVKD